MEKIYNLDEKRHVNLYSFNDSVSASYPAKTPLTGRFSFLRRHLLNLSIGLNGPLLRGSCFYMGLDLTQHKIENRNHHKAT